MKRRVPILEEIIKYRKEENLLLSMPGNKSGIGFSKDELGKEFLNTMGYLDITEVYPLDNLHQPEGIIKEAKELLKNYYGCEKAYFTVNGSTSGNLIAMFSAFDEGDEVLVERNCHRSIYNGAVLRKLKLKYIKGRVDKKRDIFIPPTEEDIRNSLEENKNIKGIILTYPNYFGICPNIENLIKELKIKGIKTIIDCAHGAHFNCTDKLPMSLTKIADYVILSAHKTIPSLTQGGYLIVNDKESDSDFYFSAFTTTSPSYLIMASLDYGRHYLEIYGEKDYEELIDRCEKWKEKINKIDGMEILDINGLEEEYSLDKTRYTIVLDGDHSGDKLLDYLREEKIQCEMSISRGVVLIFSTFNKDEDFEKLYKALINLDLDTVKYEGKIKYRFDNEIPEKKYEPYEMFKKAGKTVTLEESIGEISKEHIIPYPPGIPILCPGEIITDTIVNIIEDYVKDDLDVIGIENNNIKIIKR